MERLVSHFWLQARDGKSTLYEADYYRYRHQAGLQCYGKVHGFERICTCPDRQAREARRNASPE
jgi:hypothetical protein